jgi:hypothetical protein
LNLKNSICSVLERSQRYKLLLDGVQVVARRHEVQVC